MRINPNKLRQFLGDLQAGMKMNPAARSPESDPTPKQKPMNTEIIIRRLNAEHTDDQVTGRLSVLQNGTEVFKCFTLELPWKNNERQVSCIMPAPGAEAVYTVRKTTKSPSFNYEHLDILNTPGRTAVKVHGGNFHSQIRGCVLVGEKLADINGDGEKDTTASRNTLVKLLTFLPRECQLKIVWN